MTNPTTPATLDRTPIGVVTIGRTTYIVTRLPIGENTAACGVRNQFGLQGPRGSLAMVIDHGKGFKLRAFFLGRSGMPREFRGVTRADFAAFGVEG